MSAVEFFRLKCDGDCGRWLADVTMLGVPKMTQVWGRALTFTTESEAMDMSVKVRWTKCQCTTPDSTRHRLDCEVERGLSLCGNCRAKKRS